MAQKLFISWDEYNSIVEKLAIQIHEKYKPDLLIGIMRGAAPIIDVLSRVFKIKCAYLAVESYSGKGIEVKGADEASGSGAGRMRDSDLEKVRKPEYDKLVADFIKKFPTQNVSGIGLGKAGIMGLMNKFPKQRNYLIDSAVKLFDALFPQGGYAKEFRQALEADDLKIAQYYYGLSNMQQYHIVKADGGTDQALSLIHI